MNPSPFHVALQKHFGWQGPHRDLTERIVQLIKGVPTTSTSLYLRFNPEYEMYYQWHKDE